MASPAIDFSSIGGVPVKQGPIDFSSIGGRPVAAEAPAQAPPPQPGALQSLGSDLLSAGKSALTGNVLNPLLQKSLDAFNTYRATGKTPEQLEQERRSAAGHGLPYQVAAAAAEGLGANVPGMEQAAAEGNPAGVVGHAAAVPTMALATEGLARGVPAIADKVSGIFPSKDAAGALFQDVAKDANKVPVTLKNSQNAALSLMEWQKKTQLGPTINKFLNRITNPKLGPMNYEEARGFQQLISELSTGEKMRLSGPVQFDLNRLAAGLKADITDAASQVGRGADYTKAMQDYHDAAQLADTVKNIKDATTREVIKGLISGAGAGLGLGAAYRIFMAGKD